MANVLDKYQGYTEQQRYMVATVTLLEQIALNTTKPATFSLMSEEPVIAIEEEEIVKPKAKRKTAKKEV